MIAKEGVEKLVFTTIYMEKDKLWLSNATAPFLLKELPLKLCVYPQTHNTSNNYTRGNIN